MSLGLFILLGFCCLFKRKHFKLVVLSFVFEGIYLHEKDDDEIGFDLKRVSGFFKKFGKKAGSSEKPVDSSSQDVKSDISFDFKKVWRFVLKYKVLFLLLIPVFFSIYFRAFPLFLPVADEWAENAVHANIKSQIVQQLNLQYPHLPDKQKQALVKEHFSQFLSENKDMVEQQVLQVSKLFKERFQDSDGQTYLLAIDPWLWYGYARNFVKYGHFGNTFKDGRSWYSLRNGRVGQPAFRFNLFVFLILLNYWLLNLFGSFSVMAGAFYLPLVLIGLASVAAFFTARKFGGSVAGVVAGVVVGVHSSLLSRTIAGFTDTDNIIAFLEMFVVLFFVLAFCEKKRVKQLLFVVLAGLFMGLYANGHQSWWHIFDFVLGAVGLYFLYVVWLFRKELKKGLFAFFKVDEVKTVLRLFFGFVLSSWFFGSFVRVFLSGFGFLTSLKGFIITPFSAPFGFVSMKAVAVRSVWPNVLTTVAELNRMSLSSIASSVGGKFLFVLSVIGVLFLFFKRITGDKRFLFFGLFFGLWYAGTVFAAIHSVRFTALVVPAFAFGLASFVAFAFRIVSDWLSKGLSVNRVVSKVVVLLILVFVIFPPLIKAAESTALHQVPSMNDAWFDSLIGIKNDCDDGIITSWWDFGHWFVTVAQRRVTFDGGDQGERIHWVGKSLLTSNESVNVGILRMLNCGQEKAPHVLEKYLDNDTVRAIDVLNKIIVVDKVRASEILKSEGLSENAIDDVLAVTHCDDLLPNYYIVSDDMVGKAGVWGHFGSWDFRKASMYNRVFDKKKSNGTRILRDEFNLSAEDADRIFYEIKNNDADKWVAPWPGFMGSSACSVKDNVAVCSGLPLVDKAVVNLSSFDAGFVSKQGVGVPFSVVFADESGVHEKRLNNSNSRVSLILVPSGKGFRAVLASPEQALSMFTRLYYFKAHGLKCFDLLSYKKSISGNEIFVYKVNWDCDSVNVLDEFKVDETEKESVSSNVNLSENFSEGSNLSGNSSS